MPPSPDLFRAARPHVDNLNRLFNLTISQSRLDSTTLSSNPAFHEITRRVAGEIRPLDLSRGVLDFSQIITDLHGKPHVVKAEYIYWLDDAHWVFRYEYDTTVGDAKPHSHLHVNASSSRVPDLHNIHFPAGRLSVEHLIHHLVSEYDVKCELPRAEMTEFLANSYRSWQRTDQHLFP